jgi:hypothetical protein
MGSDELVAQDWRHFDLELIRHSDNFAANEIWSRGEQTPPAESGSISCRRFRWINCHSDFSSVFRKAQLAT